MNLNPHHTMTFRPSLDRLAFLTGLLLLLGSRASSPAADLFVQTSISGWTNIPPYALNSAWGDYDGDGLPDVHVGRSKGSDGSGVTTNLLYRNNGDGSFSRKLASEVGPIVGDPLYGEPNWIDVTFEHVTAGPVVTDRVLSSNNSSWGDLDNDGDADLLLANNSVPSLYYRNDGRGRFTRMTNSILEQPTYIAGFHALGDLDEDGDLDVVAMGSATFILLNDGAGVFTLGQSLDGTGAPLPYLGDYDNDGDLDLLVSEASNYPRPVVLYRNDGMGAFTEQTEAFIGLSRSWVVGSWTDYDNNGFLDLFMGQNSGGTQPVWLYRNQGNGNHWLKFNLAGTHSHRSAIGTKVRVRASMGGRSLWQMRELGGSLFAEDGRRVHFGLGDATRAEKVRIEWPSGNVQALTEVTADQILTVTEPLLFRPEHPVATINGSVGVTNLAVATARQWSFEGSLLEGQTNRILRLTNTQPAQAGRYTVVAQTETGPVTQHVYVRVDNQFTKILEGDVVTEVRPSSVAAWFDYDNDSFVDLYVPNGTPPNSLFHSRRDGTFERVANATQLGAQPSAVIAAPADFDGDGQLDLFVVGYDAHDQLFRGDGAGGFTPLEGQPFTLDHLPSNDGGWADIDRDGDLDVMTVGKQGSALYRNEGGGRFTSASPQDVGSLLTFPAPGRTAWNCVWSDYDADGDPDVVIMNDGAAPILHRNLGDGRFERVDAGSLTSLSSDLACAWGDYDNDGWMDAFTGRWQVGQARLHRNLGDGTFPHVPQAGDFSSTGVVGSGAWADYDNDGFLDLLFLGYDRVGSLYRNRGDGTFQGVDLGNFLSDGLRRTMPAWADYDNNGFLDLLVVCGDGIPAPNQLYRNNGNGNHWLKFKLAGTTSNRDGIGTRIRVKTTLQGRNIWQLREVEAAGGQGGHSRLLAHFGLGNATNAALVRIEWPSGIVQELPKVPADQFLTITEPAPIQLSCVRLSDGLRIECQGAAGTTYELQISDTLRSWTVGGTLTTDGNGHASTDLTPAPAEPHFYRAIKR